MTTTSTTIPTTTTTLVPGPCTVTQQLGCYKDNLGHTTMAQEVTSAITDPLTSENCAGACNAVGSFPAVVFMAALAWAQMISAPLGRRA